MLWTIQENRLTIQSPAKLNLYLEVLGKRPDGFHELETVMTAIDLYDELWFEKVPEKGIELESCWDFNREKSTTPELFASGDLSSPGSSNPAGIFPEAHRYFGQLPPENENLVYRTAKAFFARSGVNEGIRIRLTKSIPAEAGLGGASGNSAATLLGLNFLYGSPLEFRGLVDLAAEMGSDVPFFLYGGTAVCSGRGEQVDPLGIPHSQNFVVVKPGFGLSTPGIFSRLELPDSPLLFDRKSFLGGVTRLAFNRLQSAAGLLNPELTRICNLLKKYGCETSLMTGSGSCCFGFCPSESAATRVAAEMATRNVGYVFTCKNLPKFSVPQDNKAIG